MRVSFSTELKPKSGKQNFAIRLAKEMKRQGVRVTDKKPHINLVFVKGARKGCVNVLRLDGAWINNKMNSETKNRGIAKSMRQCKAVIYQSRYSRRVCRTFIGKVKRSKVIFNGCPPDLFGDKYQHPRPYVFACSRWRPHKRLKEMVEGFLESGISKDFDFLVCGADPTHVVKHPNVRYMGKRSIQEVQSIVAGCQFMAHLAYLDCCPNSVVEALVAGKRVLHTDSGGTPEIVGDSGFCVKDKPYSFKMIDLYNTPPLNMDKIVQGYVTLSSFDSVVREDLYIRKTAEKYIAFMRSLL